MLTIRNANPKTYPTALTTPGMGAQGWEYRDLKPNGTRVLPSSAAMTESAG